MRGLGEPHIFDLVRQRFKPTRNPQRIVFVNNARPLPCGASGVSASSSRFNVTSVEYTRGFQRPRSRCAPRPIKIPGGSMRYAPISTSWSSTRACPYFAFNSSRRIFRCAESSLRCSSGRFANFSVWAIAEHFAPINVLNFHTGKQVCPMLTQRKQEIFLKDRIIHIRRADLFRPRHQHLFLQGFKVNELALNACRDSARHIIGRKCYAVMPQYFPLDSRYSLQSITKESRTLTDRIRHRLLNKQHRLIIIRDLSRLPKGSAKKPKKQNNYVDSRYSLSLYST